MPTVLNWGSSVGNQTLDTANSILVPKTLAAAIAEDGVVVPDNLAGKFNYGLWFSFYLNDAGDGVFSVDENGLKIPGGYVPFSTTAGNDELLALGYPIGVLADGLYANALSLSTIRLGGGDDDFYLGGSGVVQALSSNVDKYESQGYIFQSSIFGDGGDDYIQALMPFQSVFKGGTSTAYYDAVNDPGGAGVPVTLSDSLTAEEVTYGDTIELKGSRFDWDFEFKDGNGDGIVTLDSILNETDYLAVSNNNQISGFERLRFGDIQFDLILFDQIDSAAVYGQPDYYLSGLDPVAPELNSSILADSRLWEAFRLNRIQLAGIAGIATAPLSIELGGDRDTPYLAGGGEATHALKYANLNTGGGDDIVYVQDSDQANIDLGVGADQLTLAGSFSLGGIQGGDGDDNIIIGLVSNAAVDAGAGSDVVELTAVASQSSFDGGSEDDLLILAGSFVSYAFTYEDAAAPEDVVFTDGAGNTYQDIERYQFADGELTLAQLKARSELASGGSSGSSGPPSAPRIELVGETNVTGGDDASFAVYLRGTLAKDGSIVLDLDTASGTAAEGDDFTGLVAADLAASPGLALSGVVTDPVTKAITLTINNSSGSDLPAGTQLLSFALATVRPSSTESAESFTTTLSSPNIAPDVSSILTTIAAPVVSSPGSTGGGGGGSAISIPSPPPPPPTLTDPIAPLSLPGGGEFVTADLLTGGPQSLQGGPQPDVLTGGFGPDVLSGGPAVDQLTGGPGPDIFVLTFTDPSADRILDFEPGSDRIRIESVPTDSRLARFLKGKSYSRKSAESVEGKKEAKRSKRFFVYDNDSGSLYYNANGKKTGFGPLGGLVASLNPGLDLDGTDLLFSFSDYDV